MKFAEVIKENLENIVNELHEELKKDDTIYQFIDSNFTLEKLYQIQELLTKEYIQEIEDDNLNEESILKFYKKVDVVYPIVYKCLSSLKIKILEYLNFYDLSKEEIIEFSKKFDLFNNLLAKIYLRKDVHILQDLKDSPFKKYLLYNAHLEWLEKIVYAIENDKMDEFPLVDPDECEFNQILNYPESLMVCIDLNKCSYLHDVHKLLHKTANSVYLLYMREEYIQAYLVFKELKEQTLKFIATINELYFITYSDLENVFFNFLSLLEEQKDFFVSLIDLRNLKSLNNIYGKELITKAINLIENKLKKVIEPKQDKYLLIKGVTANFYLYSDVEKESDFLELIEEIKNILEEELKIGEYKIDFDYIIASFRLEKIYDFYLSSDDLVKVLLFLKEKAKKMNKKIYFAIDEKEIETVKEWLNQKYSLTYIEEKLKNKELDVVFQPIFNTETRNYEFCETLVRIKEDEKLVSAGIFIDKVYEMGKIAELDYIVLEKIEEKINLIKKITNTIFVNVSFISLLNEKYIAKFGDVSRKINIVLELTEQKMIENLDIIKSLKDKYNIIFAIDDFGSGYSSLKTVVDLSRNQIISFLKIDGTLVKNIDKDEYLKRVMRIISVLGKELNLKVIAEFVENNEVFNLLRKLQIEYAQGYFLEKPKPIEELIIKKMGLAF